MIRIFLSFLFMSTCLIYANPVEKLDLEVIPYEKLVQEDPDALMALDRALHEKGIVGVRGVPGYREKYKQFIEAARKFSTLPETVKESYKPNRDLGETFLGYESGKEKFQQPDGTWVVDDLKTSYYAYVPDSPKNKWPEEVSLRGPFQSLGQIMADTGELVMRKIGLLGSSTGFELEPDSRLGRMLYYRKSHSNDNPYWCGSHFDHGLFTVILPAVYFVEGNQVAEPEDAGLFVRTGEEQSFKKVCANDYDIMMFQVGEFGQLVSDDEIKATEHLVQKASGAIERYTLALFYDAPMDMPVYSKSSLINDARYGAKPGEACTYRHWNQASFERYLVKDDQADL